MLGYIYVFTNKIFPENIFNIQYSISDPELFTIEFNKYYLDPINVLLIQPTVDLNKSQDYLNNELFEYKIKDNFYNINKKQIKILLLKTIVNQIKDIDITLHSEKN